MVYLQQTYRNIPVFNKMLVMAFRGGQLLSNSGSIQPFMSQVVNNKMAAPLIRAEDAVAAAMADQKLVPAQPVSGTSDRKWPDQFWQTGGFIHRYQSRAGMASR
jgi:hypothetical protein